MISECPFNSQIPIPVFENANTVHVSMYTCYLLLTFVRTSLQSHESLLKYPPSSLHPLSPPQIITTVTKVASVYWVLECTGYCSKHFPCFSMCSSLSPTSLWGGYSCQPSLYRWGTQGTQRYSNCPRALHFWVKNSKRKNKKHWFWLNG